eukprot:363865-Chlamydomonas_euryale.AAC.24
MTCKRTAGNAAAPFTTAGKSAGCCAAAVQMHLQRLQRSPGCFIKTTHVLALHCAHRQAAQAPAFGTLLGQGSPPSLAPFPVPPASSHIFQA